MGSTYVDIFATKGIEYILVISFLALLIVFWRFLMGGRQPVKAMARAARRQIQSWFGLPEGVFHHQGHGWVVPEGGDQVRVGLDDFVGKLLGPPDAVELPTVGTTLRQGETAWRVRVGAQTFAMVSPVEGEVIAVNEDVLRRPDLAGADPYKEGWLLRVRVPALDANLRNLLAGELAQDWMAGIERSLRVRMAGDMGSVLQDGGPVAPGFVRHLYPDSWDEVTRELLMTGPRVHLDPRSILESGASPTPSADPV